MTVNVASATRRVTPIKYLGFYDVPRNFIVRYANETLLFDCPFDEALDDYPDEYQVYVLPPMKVEELPKDWTALPPRALAYLGKVPLDRVLFDPSKRKSIDSAILEELIARKAAG
jgi:hypothetical protein